MSSQLDRLLESLDPSRNLDQVSARVDRAVNSFQLESGVIDRWSDYQELMTEFYCHVENIILRIERPSSEFDWSRCVDLLQQAYGQNGYKTAFDMVRTGLDGGLYAVLKEVASRMIKNYAGNEISARINHFWNDLSVQEQLATMDEYLEKYGHLLPSVMTEGSAVRIKVNFHQGAGGAPPHDATAEKDGAVTRRCCNQTN